MGRCEYEPNFFSQTFYHWKVSFFVTIINQHNVHNQWLPVCLSVFHCFFLFRFRITQSINRLMFFHRVHCGRVEFVENSQIKEWKTTLKIIKSTLTSRAISPAQSWKSRKIQILRFQILRLMSVSKIYIHMKKSSQSYVQCSHWLFKTLKVLVSWKNCLDHLYFLRKLQVHDIYI